ncbi:E3 ubiquitin-protein ligase RNF181-like [Oppia nitens]|uniref:E3 ubiquitin-protein ligase RNF181-like n=1 Tax=Oppia nitens TaxID=1686743 RepID=UPI0023DB9B84|nr:E3 ubiquitin-protein ligase RNF181-like [Oppia nitens]
MSSYYDEHECPDRTPEQETNNLYLSLARMLHDLGFDAVDAALNGHSGERRPPASKHFIENLPKVNDFGKDDKCCVCLKEFTVDQTVRVGCGHRYHRLCITEWLRLNNSCPVCRTEFPTDDEEYERNKREKMRRETTLQELHNSMFS